MVKSQIGHWVLGSGIAIALLGLGGCNQLGNVLTSSPSPTPSVTGKTPQSTKPPVGNSSGSTAPAPISPSIKRSQPEVYWLATRNNKVSLSPSPLTVEPGKKTEEARLTSALERLMKGPANADVTTTIPKETKLNSLKVKADGVHVDLNKAFTTGGGSAAMQGRLGQIIYTASSLNPDVPIWLSVDGEPLKVLGGEGLEVSQPMTRKEFDQSFSL